MLRNAVEIHKREGIEQNQPRTLNQKNSKSAPKEDKPALRKQKNLHYFAIEETKNQAFRKKPPKNTRAQENLWTIDHTMKECHVRYGAHSLKE